MKSAYKFKQGMVINCSLANEKEVCPPEVNYTWISCENGICNENTTKFRSESYSIRLDKLATAIMMYQCMASNTAGSDYKTTDVFEQTSK